MRIIHFISIILAISGMILLGSGCNGVQSDSISMVTASENQAVNTGETIPVEVQTSTPPQVEVSVSPSVQVSTPPARLETVATASRRGDAGKLAVDKKLIDFGEVEPSSSFSGVFTLTNDGNEDLTITSLAKSCTCTVGKLKVPTTLKPGESVPLEVNFITPPQPVKVLQTVTIHTRAPSLPDKMVVSVTAQVKRLVQALPEQLELKLGGEEITGQEIVIESTDGRDFTINSYTVSAGVLGLKYDRQAQSTRHTLTIIDVDREKLKQVPFGYLIVKVTHPKISDVNIPFRAILPFSAFPPTGRFYNLVPGQSREVAFKIISNFQEDFELGDIRAEKGIVTVKSTSKTSDGYRILVELTVPEGSRKIVYRDQLHIEIADRPEDTLTLDCYGYLKPTG